METSVRNDLQEYYNEHYNDMPSRWRKLGAIEKYNNIITLTGDQSFEKVVEVGAGDGSILELLNNNNNFSSLYALEISDSGIELIKKRKLKKLQEAINYDGYKTPYPDNYFDLAILSHVLEHVEFPRKLLRELKRISKMHIIEVPREYHHNIDININHYLSYGHISVYTPSLLRFLLKSEGFEIMSERKAFYSKEILSFHSKTFMEMLKVNIFIIIRNIAFRILPMWRTDTMINSYTVFSK